MSMNAHGLRPVGLETIPRQTALHTENTTPLPLSQKEHPLSPKTHRLAAFAVAAVAALATALTSSAGDDLKTEPGYTSLFNGKDLTGWTYKGSKANLEGMTETPDGRIKVENGVIVVMEKDSKGKGGI